MPGYATERFVDLSPELTDEFRCSICLNILCDAVDTKCRHSYCYECIEQWLTSQPNKKCPECKQSVVTNNRLQQYSSGKQDNRDPKLNELLIGTDVVIYRNRRVNAIIGRLRVKCEWEANGCPDVMALNTSAGHSAKCEYRVCDRCGLLYTHNDDKRGHDCVKGLLSDRNRWRDDYLTDTEKLGKKVETLTQLNDELVNISDQNIRQLTKLREENKQLMVIRDQKHNELTKLRRENKGLMATKGDNEAKLKTRYLTKCKESDEMVSELRKRVTTLDIENNSLRKKYDSSQCEDMAMPLAEDYRLKYNKLRKTSFEYYIWLIILIIILVIICVLQYQDFVTIQEQTTKYLKEIEKDMKIRFQIKPNFHSCTAK